ncbi:hypothetical protein E2C01_058536 [Portunus trituberculatus]|uniref:Uncharacterized protein n=1 Tax=Portunus trituberculatus TaxID=210409 RepID=A0A5B7GWQ6_PORTR|nr:hypothetical protein [Portunus trituberculatus]
MAFRTCSFLMRTAAAGGGCGLLKQFPNERLEGAKLTSLAAGFKGRCLHDPFAVPEVRAAGRQGGSKEGERHAGCLLFDDHFIHAYFRRAGHNLSFLASSFRRSRMPLFKLLTFLVAPLSLNEFLELWETRPAQHT